MTPAEKLTDIAGRLVAASGRVRETNASRQPLLDQASAWSELMAIAQQASADLNVLGLEFERRALATRQAILDADPNPRPRLHLQQRRMTRCQADDDDDCTWQHCPQVRDNEPASTGRHCPLDQHPEDNPEETPCTDPS